MSFSKSIVLFMALVTFTGCSIRPEPLRDQLDESDDIRSNLTFDSENAVHGKIELSGVPVIGAWNYRGVEMSQAETKVENSFYFPLAFAKAEESAIFGLDNIRTEYDNVDWGFWGVAYFTRQREIHNGDPDGLFSQSTVLLGLGAVSFSLEKTRQVEEKILRTRRSGTILGLLTYHHSVSEVRGVREVVVDQHDSFLGGFYASGIDNGRRYYRVLWFFKQLLDDE